MTNGLLILSGFIFMSLVMSIFWLRQKRHPNPSIVDVLWTLGIGFLSIFYFYFTPGLFYRRLIILSMVLFWSLRLSMHLISRIRTLPEDGRYTEMRERWGINASRNFFLFFQLQAFWSVLFSLPALIAMNNSQALNIIDLFGILLWVISISGESIADKQLSVFRTNPNNKGKVCNKGLWKYSRHPNYFFEWIQWWAYLCFAQNVWALLGPAVMLYFLLYVTGVPPTERQSLKSRGEAYRDYQRTTSKFFPWFTRS